MKSATESAFVKNKSRKSGFEGVCKECRNRQIQLKKVADPQAFAAAAAARKYRYNHTEKGRISSRNNHQKFHQNEIEYGRKYYQENKENRIANTQNWRRNNPEKVRVNNAAYRQRQSVNPVFVFSRRLRSSLRKAWTGSKCKPTFDLLGYDRAALLHHLNPYLSRSCVRCNLVTIDLTNSHIDHILPLAGCQSNEDVIRLNQLTNLRLICRTCNQAKGYRLE
jgi:5-methylcytosine-specific restriction endonuclease McrA